MMLCLQMEDMLVRLNLILEGLSSRQTLLLDGQSQPEWSIRRSVDDKSVILIGNKMNHFPETRHRRDSQAMAEIQRRANEQAQ